MRRFLWNLAAGTALGATVSWTMAEDPFAFPETPAQSQSAGRPSSLSFSSGRATPGTATTGRAGDSPSTSTTATTQPFPGERTGLPRAGSLSDVRASDLFRREVARPTPSSGGVTGDMLEDQFQRVAGVQADPNRNVVHAEYERLPGQRESVEQIRGTTAREFPAAEAPSQPAAQQFEPLPQTSLTQGGYRPAPVASRLTQPIATTPTQSFGGFTAQPAVQSSRGVTFTRSAPETPTVQTPVIQQTSATVPAAAPSRVTPAAVNITTPATDASGALAQTVRSGPQAPTVSIEWVTRSGINVGQQCECNLVVKNTGIIAARQVELSATFPTSVRLVACEPQPIEVEGKLGWTFAELQPGQEQIVKITMIPSVPGKIDTQADVRFSGAARTSLTVAEPLIEVSVDGPQRVLIGEPASQTVTVKNPGSGIATNVQIEAVIPSGLEHARGERLIMDIGSLNPGENRSVRLALAAVKGGKQVVQVQARADGDLVRNITSEVYVVAPTLVAEIEGPTLRYLGRPAVYHLRVRNDGEINVENVRVMHKMPDGFEVLETDRGAQFDRPNRLVNWFVGRLAAGQTAEMKLTVRPDQLGNFTHFIRATSEHGAIADAQFSTSVEGTSSLAMEIRDLDDPVEVGVETAYEIVVKNEGSAAARSVSLVCEIPAGMDVINAQGPVDSIKQRDLVSFNPVQELAPGNSITYRVHIRGNVGGHHRLRARLSSDGNPEPITGDEVTRFYGE